MKRLSHKKFSDYTEIQHKIIDKGKERINLARQIGKNAYEIGLIEYDPSFTNYSLRIHGPKSDLYIKDLDSDTKLRTSSNITRSRETRIMNPVCPERSKDPVYRKLGKVKEICDSGIIRDVTNELHIRMEYRQGMDETI